MQILVIIALLAVLAYMLYGSITWFGLINGEEFSPDSFSRRTFRYREIPLIGLPVTPITRKKDTRPIEQHLANQNLVGQKVDEPRWDLVVATRGLGLQQIRQGDAKILCEYLDTVDDESGTVWLKWTKDNKELAKVFWPAIDRLAQQGLYVFVPDLFHLAARHDDPELLRRAIQQTLTKKYLQRALSLQALGEHQGAALLFSEALKQTPESVEALIGRAESRSELGEQAKAEEDLAEAERLEGSREVRIVTPQ